MKKFFLFFIFLPFLAAAQEKTQFEIVEHTAAYDIIRIKVGAASMHYVNTPQGLAHSVSIDRGTQIIEKGAPNVPKLSFSLIVPNGKDADIEILDAQYTDQQQQIIAPSKGKIYRDEDPDDYPHIYGEAYQRNAFYPGIKTRVNSPYIIRDFRGQAIHTFPVQYNPVTKTLRLYNEFLMKVSYTKPAQENILQAPSEFPQQISNEYHEIYKYQFLNYKVLFGQYAPLPQHGKMLILCADAYKTALPEFIEWKERKGIEVFFEIADTITGGPTEANLLSRVSDYYNNKQITYLLLVGDATDIPAQNSYWNLAGLYGPSDWAFAYQMGNDHYPEFIVGRISADTLQDAVIQVQKSLAYEQAMNNASTWMKRQVAIGSEQGPGDKGQYDHQHLREIADSNKNSGNYIYNYEIYDGTHGGNDAPGDPPANELTNAINAGVGLINYCGHGSTDIFITSSFIGSQHVPLLTNTNGRWPFIFSTACSNGNFVYATCLAEGLMRGADSLGNPTGAIATIMSSIVQSWDPPMQGQDEMNALLRHARPGTYQTTFGAITSSAIMSTNDHYNTPIDSNGGNEIADTWVVFGDPNLSLYTQDDGILTCTHDTTIGKYSTTFEVQCAEDNTLIGLYYLGDFLASAVVHSGVATFNFPQIVNLDTIFVTATKQNFKPYYGTVIVDNGIPFSVNDLEQFNISVYPNPTANVVRVLDKNKLVQKLELFDLNGRLLLQTEAKEVDMTQLATGVYHLRLQTKNGVLGTNVQKK